MCPKCPRHYPKCCLYHYTFSLIHSFEFFSSSFQALFSYSKGQTTDDSSLRQARFNAMRLLLLHRQHIATDPWISLPELTNDNAG